MGKPSQRCSFIVAGLILLVGPAGVRAEQRAGVDLFSVARSTPFKVRARADWSPARMPLLGGWLGKRVQVDVSAETRSTGARLEQTRTIVLKVPGWGNNQAGVRGYVEVYTDPRTGNPVVRTVQRIKVHDRDTYQYRNPSTGRTEYASDRSSIPTSASRVKELSAFWLNSVVVKERRTMALSPAAKRAALLIAKSADAINRALDQGADLPRSLARYFASDENVAKARRQAGASSGSTARTSDSFGVAVDPIRGGVTVGNQDVGGVVVDPLNPGRVGISLGNGINAGVNPLDGLGFGQ